MRLDKFISNNSSVSRSDVRRLVKRKAVLVNGIAASDCGLHISPMDTIALDGQVIASTGKVYYMLNKPAGVICANQAGEYPTVLDLLSQDANNPFADTTTPVVRAQELQIAGRLDVGTTGLVLITNDGQWNHRLTSPRHGCQKVYRVTLARPFDPATEPAFKQGILLDGETKPTLPATIELLDDTHLLLTIQEGKYHQVKRMFFATSNEVVGLHRESVGDILLDPALRPGEFRPLTQIEADSIWRQSEREPS